MKLSNCCNAPVYGDEVDPLCSECHEHCEVVEFIEVVFCFRHPEIEATYMRDEYVGADKCIGICDKCYAETAELMKKSLRVEQILHEDNVGG